MAGEIKGSSEPITRGDIELAATSLVNLGDCPLERQSIQGNPIPNSSEISKVEDEIPELGNRPRRRGWSPAAAVVIKETIDGVFLPEGDEDESGGPNQS